MFKRLITSLAIIVPLILIIGLQNFWIFFLMISIVCLAAFFEWKKNNFRHPILWGFTLIFLYFWTTVNFIVASYAHSDVVSNISIFYLFFIFILNTAIFYSFAFFVGSNVGKNSISPKISPNKTISGTIGSFLLSMIPLIIVLNINFLDLKLNLTNIAFCLLISLISQLGDLFISFIKRKANTKDTGNVLPGHGGILDRLDGIIFAVPFSYFLLKLI